MLKIFPISIYEYDKNKFRSVVPSIVCNEFENLKDDEVVEIEIAGERHTLIKWYVYADYVIVLSESIE